MTTLKIQEYIDFYKHFLITKNWYIYVYRCGIRIYAVHCLLAFLSLYCFTVFTHLHDVLVIFTPSFPCLILLLSPIGTPFFLRNLFPPPAFISFLCMWTMDIKREFIWWSKDNLSVATQLKKMIALLVVYLVRPWGSPCLWWNLEASNLMQILWVPY